MRQGGDLTRGYTFGVGAAAVLSTTAVFIRYLTETYAMPPLVLAFWRDVFVVVALVPVLAVARPELLRVPRRHLGYLVGYGLLLSVYNAMWTFSVAMNGAAVATVLIYSSAAFTALFGWWLLREHLGWAKLLAVGLSLTGCWLVAGLGGAGETVGAAGGGVMGALVGIGSGLCYTAYTLMGRKAWQRGLNPWTTVLYIFVFASCFLALPSFFGGAGLPGAAPNVAGLFYLGRAWVGWLVLFVLGAGPTVLGYGLYNMALTHLPSSVAQLIVTLEPVFTAVLAYTLLAERFAPAQVAGGLLTLGAVVFLRVYEGRVRRVGATVAGGGGAGEGTAVPAKSSSADG